MANLPGRSELARRIETMLIDWRVAGESGSAGLSAESHPAAASPVGSSHLPDPTPPAAHALAPRKLRPARLYLDRSGYVAPEFPLVGFDRMPMPDETFRTMALEGIKEYATVGEVFDEKTWESFGPSLYYQSGGYDKLESMQQLAAKVAELEASRKTGGNRLFYFATPPDVFMPVTWLLKAVGLAHAADKGRDRLIIETPFCH